MEMKKIPVIIDCDPGIDDAMALMVAFALPQFDVKAITTVAGNVSIEKVTVNARSVLSTLGVKSKIYKGAKGPLMGTEVIEAPEAHGVGGLGSYSLAEEKWHPLEEMSALEAQKKILEESKEPVTIIAVGPLTNIAILIKSYPELIKKIAKLSIMGGGLYTGNHTEVAEFNILADPEAAEIVFKSGIPILMAGLDVTHQAKMHYNDVKGIRAVNNQVSDMIADTLEFYFDIYPENERQADDKYTCMHDSVSVLALIYPEMYEGEDLRVMVETAGVYSRGYTIADLTREGRGKNPNSHVLLKLDRDFFYNKIIEALKSYN